MFWKNLSVNMIILGTLLVAMPRLTQQRPKKNCITCGIIHADEEYSKGFQRCTVDVHPSIKGKVSPFIASVDIQYPEAKECSMTPSANLVGIVEFVADKYDRVKRGKGDYLLYFSTPYLTAEDDTLCFKKIWNSSFAMAGCANSKLFDCVTYLTEISDLTPPSWDEFTKTCFRFKDESELKGDAINFTNTTVSTQASEKAGNATDFTNATESTQGSEKAQQNCGNGIKKIGLLAYALLCGRMMVN